MNILVPPGIGDIFWCLLKIKDIYKKNGDGKGIHLKIACWNKNEIESRALEFSRRFDFIDSAEMYEMPRGSHGPVLKMGEPTDKRGYYRYLDTGPTKEYSAIDYVAVPNGVLEEGRSILDWVPQAEADFSIVQNNLKFTQDEIDFGNSFKERFKDYAVFYMGGLSGNTDSGHNRNSLWKPEDWIKLGDILNDLYNLNIIVVGAGWDKSYYNQMIRPLNRSKRYWYDYINHLPIFMTYQVIKNSKLLVSYQSGIGIISNYLEVPTVMWWRPYGDSISPNEFVSFNENMNQCWAKPGTVENKKYMPCVYTKHGVPEIVEFINNNFFLKKNSP